MKERIVKVFEHLKRFGQSELDHVSRGAFGGDPDWGDSEPEILLEKPKLFSPRQDMANFLNSTSGRLTMEAGGTVITIAGALKFQEMTGIPLPMIFLYPFR